MMTVFSNLFCNFQLQRFDMRLIADSGGSGTTWALIQNNEVVYYEGAGLHPDIISEDSEIPGDVLVLNEQISDLRFYGTGCALKNKAERVHIFLEKRFPNASINVYSDLLALAHPVLKKRKGLVAILGTGSSMSFYDGNDLHFEIQSPGKGADPGSGPVIAHKLIQLFNAGKLSKESEELLKSIQSIDEGNDQTLSAVAKLLFTNLHIADFKRLCANAFDEFIQFYAPVWRKNNYPIVFGGSIAALGLNVLKDVLFKYEIELEDVVRYPIEKLAGNYSK